MATYFKRLTNPLFFAFVDYLDDQVTLNAGAWNIPVPIAAELATRRGDYGLLFGAIINKQVRTPQQVQDHDEGRKDFEDFIEPFANQYIVYNPLISNSVCEALGFNRPPEEPGVRPTITDTVVAAMEPKAGFKIESRCKTFEDSSRASIHPDADEVEMRYSVNTVPANVNQCPNTHLSSKAKFTLAFDPADEGKKVYAYYRWRNRINPEKSGPWSTRYEAIIRN